MAFIRLPVDQQGKRVRTVNIEEGGETLHMEAVVLSDPTSGVSAAVDADGRLFFVDERSLTQRMFEKSPQTGSRLWLDTADASYIYIAEAPAGSDPASATAWQGIRITKDANGNPLGGVLIATNFAWNNRSSATWT